ncbi:uncharacterized protein QC764_711000 [Podospora pseudoanserina]|uniref:Uncharacterized protein n=1 Tax=Podospora pseudoanserina TaxID=2609844 RepID=A0ABR0HLK7_9PEZI|nr:hypothetical protein QC764_711000 [Podospora pseudoanserina]
MAAPSASQVRAPKVPVLEPLEKGLNEILVLTGKAFRAAGKDPKKGTPQETAAAINAQVPAVIGRFNNALDDLECDLLRAKAVLLRDLNQLKANQKPPPPPKQKPVAPSAASIPPAPIESPVMAKKAQVFKGNMPGSSRPAPSPVAVPVHPTKQENKPVAPIPNMGGIDLSSPELKHSPSPKTVPRSKPVKNSPQLASVAAAAAAAGRPASAPPKKESKILPPQIPRPGTAAPQFPSGPATMQAKAASVPARNMSASPAMANSTPVAGAAPQQSQGLPQASSDNFFTDMTFTVAPSAEQPGQHQQPQQIDMSKLDGSNNFGVGSGSSTMDVDNEIDNLFEDISMNMDYNLEGGDSAGDNSNFNDMYFDLEASSGAATSGNNNNNGGGGNNLGLDDFGFPQ